MSERTSYPPGTPSWVDLASPDLDASSRFYGELFGWTAHETGPVEETGGYRMFTLRDKYVAGLGPLQGEGRPPMWTTYINVADAGASMDAVREAGGQVLMNAFDVMDAGRMGVFRDPVGAVAAVWQPGRHIGAQLVNEPGTLSWNELTCRAPDKAKPFYASVFGWQGDTQPQGDVDYTVWKLGGDMVGGMIEMDEHWPAGVPAHWMPYFAVEDADAAAERARGLAGNVSVPPTDIPVGRFTVLNDPQGAVFTAIRLNPAPDG